MRPRIAITGMGVCSAIGTDTAGVLERLRQGQSGIGTIGCFDTTGFVMKQGGEVREFDPYEHLSPPEARQLDRATQMAILASTQAFANAGLSPAQLAGERIGVVVGANGSGHFQSLRFTRAREPDVGHEAALLAAKNVPHFLTEQLARRFQLHGPHATLCAGSAGSALAFGYALDLLQAGKADLVLAGGSEGLDLVPVVAFEALGLATPGPYAPFSGDSGITLGEGAAFLVLEPLDHARRRNAPVLAELLEYAVSHDGQGALALDRSGAGLYSAMRQALQRSGVRREEIDWIKANGTGNREQDLAETLAIRRLYEGAGAPPPVSSLEPYFGHATGAAPALGLLASVLCLNAGILPPTLNFNGPRPGCDLDYVPNHARPGAIRTFLVNAMGIGGINAVLVGGPLEPERPRPSRRRDAVGITGLGLVSPLGCSPQAFLEALRQGRSGILPIDRFETGSCRARRAGLVRDFVPRRLLPTAEVRRLDRLNQYATVAAGLALKEAGLDRLALPEERIGVVIGLTRGPVTSQERFLGSLHKEGLRASVRYVPGIIGTVGGLVAQALPLRGLNATVVDGIGAGLQALLHGYEILRQNDALDALLVVAADEIGPFYVHLFDSLGVLATEAAPGGERLAPYAADAPGLVLGEGAVAVVLERLGSARLRQARVYAWLRGCGLLADACAYQAGGYDGVEPEGKWLQGAMELALAEGGVDAADLDMIYGHGKGAPLHDQREVRAIGRLLDGRRAPVGCVMGNTGVAEASCGLFSVAAAVLGMERGELYPIVTGGAVGEELAFVRGGVRAGEYRRALVAGSTENGNNAALLLERDAA